MSVLSADSSWDRLTPRFRVRQVLVRNGPAGALIADDLVEGHPALVRVFPVGWMQGDMARYFDHAREQLSQLPSPPAPPLELILGERVVFLARRHLEGANLAEWSRAEGADPATLVDFARHLLEDLSRLHERGVLHGNLTPSHIVINAGRPTIVDYGLRELGRDESTTFAMVDAFDTARDAAMLGAVLLAAADTIEHNHRVSSCPGERLDYDVWAGIRAVLERLSTSNGYQLLSAASADLNRIACTLQGGPHPSVPVGSQDLRRDLGSSAFVARPEEWAILRGAFDLALTERAQSILITGPAGIGKTRLVQEFSGWATHAHGVQVIYSKSDLDVAPRPHHLLTQLVNSLRHGHEASDLAPVALPGEIRVREAARWIIQHMQTSPKRPTLLIIDDCQFTQDEDRLLVDSLAEEIRDVGPGVAVIFLQRDVDHTGLIAAPVLEQTVHRVVKVAPLTDARLHSLVVSMAGQLDGRITDQVVEWSSGNPLAAQNAIRFLVDTSAIVPGPEGWVGRHELPVPPSVLAARITSLPLPTRLTLKTAAVIGNRGTLPLLAQATNSSENVCHDIVTDLADKGFLQTRALGTDCCFEFNHDTVREAALSDDVEGHSTTPDVHGAVADALLSGGSRDPFALAFHLASAGRLSAAHEHAVCAGRLAKQQYSLATARQYFEIALQTRKTWELLRELGEVLMLMGSYSSAADMLTEALEMQVASSTDPLAHARTLQILGNTRFKMGALRQAEGHLVNALGLIGENVPETTADVLKALFGEVVLRRLGRPLPEPANTDSQEKLRLHAGLLGSLLYCWWFHDTLKTLWSQARELRVLRQIDEIAPERGHALATQAIMYGCVFGMHRSAVQAGEQAKEIRRRSEDTWGSAHADHLFGVSLLAVADNEPGLELITRALARFDETADRWEAHTARWHRALALHRLGEAAEAAAEAAAARSLAEAIGDRQNYVLASTVKALASDVASGDEVHANASMGLDDEGFDAQCTVYLHLARALQLARTQDLCGADDALAAAARVMRKAHILNTYVAPVLSWRATVARWRAEQSPARSRESARLALTALGRAAVARLGSIVYRTEREHAAAELESVRELLQRHVGVPFGSRGGRSSSRARGGIGAPEGGSILPPTNEGNGASPSDKGPILRLDASTSGVDAVRRLARCDHAAVVEMHTADSQSPLVRSGGVSAGLVEWLHRSGTVPTDVDRLSWRIQTNPPHLTQLLVLPLGEGTPLALVLERDGPTPFTAEERATAGLVRAVLAQAVQMDEAAQSQAAASIMREESWRTRLTSDLHDEVGQRLSASLIDVRRLGNFLRHGDLTAAADTAERIGDQLVACNRGVRDLVYEASPPSLSQFGLSAAIRDLVERANSLAPTVHFLLSMPTDVDGLSLDTIPETTAVACFRIIQEAVTNVIKHAEARECAIMVMLSPDRLTLTIDDDGTGLRAGSVSRGFGLVSMRERAAAVGGTCQLEGRPGTGTTVSVTLPLDTAIDHGSTSGISR